MVRRFRWHLTPLLVLAVIFVRLLLAVALSSRPLSLEDDALLYHDTGTHYAWAFWAAKDWPLIDWGWGTNNYALFTGIFYSVFGPHRLPIMLFDSALAGIGSFLLLGILLDRYPRAHPALKLFTLFDPSMLYWTSIHGKDPLMFFFIALVVSGINKMMKHQGYIQASIGVLGMALIRPHIALILVLCALFGFGLYRTFAAAMAGILLVVFLNVSLAFYSTHLNNWATGGAALEIRPLNNAWDVVLHILTGIVATLFRPFPWESGSEGLRVAGIYGLAISTAVILIVVAMWQKQYVFASPFRRFLIAYCLGMTLFSAALAANLGDISRHRVQFIPLLWLLLASLWGYPVVRRFKAHIAESQNKSSHWLWGYR